MNCIEHHLLNMCLLYIVAIRIACCQRYRIRHYHVSPSTSSTPVFKLSIYFCVQVGRYHCRDVNHLPFSQNSKKCFVTRSIDKFSRRISTREIILVVERRACDKQIDYFRAITAGTELYTTEAKYCMSLCFNGKTLTYLNR